MPRNSTGNYTLPLPPVVSGELIEATWANTTLDDIGQAITDSLDRYGRGGMLASFLFADGTVSNPGAAWANAPGTGFYRDSTHLGFTWNGAEVFSYNANGISGKVSTLTVAGPLNLTAPDGNLYFKYTDTQSGTSEVAVATPDSLGRGAIKFVQTANGAGSDSAIEFWTNIFGAGRDARVRIDASGLLRMNAGARVQYAAAMGWLNSGGSDAWRMDIDGASNFYVYNVGSATAQLTLNADRSSIFQGTLQVKDLISLAPEQYGMIYAFDDGGVATVRFRAEPGLWASPYAEMLLQNSGWLSLTNCGLKSSGTIIGYGDADIDGQLAVKCRMTTGAFAGLASSDDSPTGSPCLRLYNAADWKMYSGSNGDLYLMRNGDNAVRWGSNDLQFTKQTTFNGNVFVDGYTDVRNWGVGYMVSQSGTGVARFRTESQRAVLESFNADMSAGARCSLDPSGVFRAKQVVATASP